MSVEVTFNDRPLGYVEEDVQQLVFIRLNHFIESEDHPEEEEIDLRERAKYLKKCKDTMWNSWTRE